MEVKGTNTNVLPDASLQQKIHLSVLSPLALTASESLGLKEIFKKE
ncbi:MAG: hypothetical protein K8I29_15980 [Alphaproteobacteria bacterium]|uniref:Uncharacterized protein n=1 Tax=Candidatus Nitrobium versatile TaxID=2884831 RepID=A0A953JDN6_9BACT|nr:hypothetical protein [Candidatus Nitrobium versatile]